MDPEGQTVNNTRSDWFGNMPFTSGWTCECTVNACSVNCTSCWLTIDSLPQWPPRLMLLLVQITLVHLEKSSISTSLRSAISSLSLALRLWESKFKPKPTQLCPFTPFHHDRHLTFYLHIPLLRQLLWWSLAISSTQSGVRSFKTTATPGSLAQGFLLLCMFLYPFQFAFCPQ